MKITEAGKSLIKRFEGLRLKAYRCSAHVLTIGWGSTRGVKEGDAITRAEAEDRFNGDLRMFDTGVARMSPDLTATQHSAATSFAFNLGLGAYQRSTLRMKANRGEHEDAAKEFLKWCRAGGKVLIGLQSRRIAEAELYMRD